MSDKLLSVLLKFSLDNASVDDAIKKFESVENALENIDDEALVVGATIEKALGNAVDKLDAKTKSLTSSLSKMRSGAEKLGADSRVIFGLGAGLAGSVFASASNYVSEMEKSGEITSDAAERWVSANNSIKSSMLDVGKASLDAAIPVLEKAADIAEKIADFVEENPNVVKAAMNAGIAMAGLAAVGIAASKGIKLIADAATTLASVQNLAAGKLMEAAAAKNLAASLSATKLSGVATVVEASGAGGIASGALSAGVAAVGSALVYGVAAWVGANIGDWLLDAVLGRDDYISKTFETAKQSAASFTGLVLTGLKGIGLISDETASKLYNASKSVLWLGDEAEKSAKPIKGLENELSSLREDELESTKKYNSEVASVVADAATKMKAATASLKSSLLSASQNFEKAIASINKEFSSQSSQDAAAYYQKRNEITKNANQELRDIESDHQEELRKAALEHNQRMIDLTSERDALGLILEQEKYDKEVSEMDRAADLSAKKIDEKVSRELQDASEAYRQQREQRLQQYKDQIAEAELKRKEDIAAAKKRFEEEKSRIKSEESEKLSALSESRNKERSVRIKSYNNLMSDLNMALNKEREIRNKYNNAMVSDLNALMKSAEKSMPPGKNIPKYATGGYINQRGYIEVAENGKEFILNNQTTRSIESILGGRINQQDLVRELGRNVTVNDNRKFDSSLSRAEIEFIKNETFRDLAEIFAT